MSDNARSADDDEDLFYDVRPEPPRFDELIRRPALYSNESPFRPAGPVRRWFGARRSRILFRAGLVAAFGFVVAAIVF